MISGYPYDETETLHMLISAWLVRTSKPPPEVRDLPRRCAEDWWHGRWFSVPVYSAAQKKTQTAKRFGKVARDHGIMLIV